MEIKKLKQHSKRSVYIVVDPAMQEALLLSKLVVALQEDVVAVQVWDNFHPKQNIPILVKKITGLCHRKAVPVLINNNWQQLLNSGIDGVHFDHIPPGFEKIKATIGRPFIAGLTCNNDLSCIHWANEHHIDYISFCSIFPSTTGTSCELVKFDTIRETRKLTTLPIFLAGGIRPENVKELQELDFDGIAVISGVMSAVAPDESIKAYQIALNTNGNETINHQ